MSQCLTAKEITRYYYEQLPTKKKIKIKDRHVTIMLKKKRENRRENVCIASKQLVKMIIFVVKKINNALRVIYTQLFVILSVRCVIVDSMLCFHFFF